MEILTPKTTRRSTRLRVEIPLTVTSMDRRHPLCASCVALVVSPQGCGLRSAQALPIGTPVLLSGLPGAASASAHVANCLPLGNDGKYFLIGASLYNHGNVWGIANPPEDWNCTPNAAASAAAAPSGTERNQNVWPYNLLPKQGNADRRRK